jgi:hypothetical protein
VGLIMRIKLYLLVAFILIVFFGYVFAKGSRLRVPDNLNNEVDTAPVSDLIINEFIDNGWDFLIPETSKSLIIATLGDPDSVIQDQRINPYSNESDVSYVLHYLGLCITFIELNQKSGGGIVLTSIVISDEKWPVKYLNIGMSPKAVTARLNRNYRWLDADTLEYSNGLHTPTVVLLHFLKNHLVKIEWQIYSG